MNFVDANGMARTWSAAAGAKASQIVAARTSTPTRTAVYPPVTAPKTYTSPQQEYYQTQQAARTPSPQEYQQLQRAGANISYGQYVNQKLNTPPQSYNQFIYNKSLGKPNYTTYGATTVIQQQQSTYYANSGNYIAANMPSVEYKQTIQLHECAKIKSVPDIPDTNALGAGDYGKITKEDIVSAAKTLSDFLSIFGKSIEITVGVGQGLGGSLEIADIGADIELSANYFELRLDDGEISIGQSIKGEASLDLLFADVGIRETESHDFDGNILKDKDDSFKLYDLKLPNGVGVSAYFIVGGSANIEINYEDLYENWNRFLESVNEG